jgi:hypothetical protein
MYTFFVVEKLGEISLDPEPEPKLFQSRNLNRNRNKSLRLQVIFLFCRVSALIGAVVADAASLPLEWIYKPETMKVQFTKR